MALQDLTKPVLYNITVTRNDSWRKEFTVKEGGVAVDISTYTPKAQIREYEDGPLIAEFDVVSESDLPNGLIVVKLDETQTCELDGDAVWDLEIRLDPENHHTLVRGKVTVVLDTTK